MFEFGRPEIASSDDLIEVTEWTDREVYLIPAFISPALRVRLLEIATNQPLEHSVRELFFGIGFAMMAALERPDEPGDRVPFSVPVHRIAVEGWVLIGPKKGSDDPVMIAMLNDED